MPHTLVGLFLIGSVILGLVLQTHGKITTGVITDLRSIRGTKGSTAYYVTYSYTAEGSRIGGEQISRSRYKSMHVGDRVTVRYLHGDHFDRSALQGPAIDVARLIFAIFWNAFVVVFLWLLYVVPRRRRWLVKNGEVAPGRITRKYSTTGKSRACYIEYESEPKSGNPIAGKMTVLGSDYVTAKEGDSIFILFDPLRPRRNLVYGFVDYEIAPQAYEDWRITASHPA